MATLNPALIQSESGGNYAAARTNVDDRTFTGRGQFGVARLNDLGMGTDFTFEQFRDDPEVQRMVEGRHATNIDNYINANNLDQFVGQEFNGVPMTREGMQAIAHLGGNAGLNKFLNSGGSYNPSDELGTSLMAYGTKFSGGDYKTADTTPLNAFANERAEQASQAQKQITARMDDLVGTQDAAFRLTTGLSSPREIMEEQAAKQAQNNQEMQRTALDTLREQIQPELSVRGQGGITDYLASSDQPASPSVQDYGPVALASDITAPNQAFPPQSGVSPTPGGTPGPLSDAIMGHAREAGNARGAPAPFFDPAQAAIDAAPGPAPFFDPAQAAIDAAPGPMAMDAPTGPVTRGSGGAAGGPVPSPSGTGEAAPQSAAEEKDPWNWKLSLFEGLEGASVGLGQMSVGQAVNLGPTFARQEAAKLGRDRLDLDQQSEDRLGGEAAAGAVGDRNFQNSVADAFIAQNGDTPENRVIANSIRGSFALAEETAKDIGPSEFRIDTEEQRQSVADRAVAAGLPELAKLADTMSGANYVNKVLADRERQDNPLPTMDVHDASTERWRQYADANAELAPAIENMLMQRELALDAGNKALYNQVTDSLTSILESSTEQISQKAHATDPGAVREAVWFADDATPAQQQAYIDANYAKAGIEGPYAQAQKQIIVNRVGELNTSTDKQKIIYERTQQAQQFMKSPNFKSGGLQPEITAISSMAETLGITISPYVAEQQGFEGVMKALLPYMRVPGTGSMSDWEGKMNEMSIASLGKEEGANRMLLQVAERTSAAMISDNQAEKQFLAMQDPTTGTLPDGRDLQEYQKDEADRKGLYTEAFYQVTPTEGQDTYDAVDSMVNDLSHPLLDGDVFQAADGTFHEFDLEKHNIVMRRRSGG